MTSFVASLCWLRAAEHWVSEKDDPKRPVMRARLRGLQEQMVGLLPYVLGRMTRSWSSDVQGHVLPLITELTGHDFDETDRPAHPHRAAAAHVAAGKAVAQIKAGFMNSMTARGTGMRLLRM